MNNVNKRWEASSVGNDSLVPKNPFFERPEGLNRSMSEVAPMPSETNEQFIERADKELSGIYPDSDKHDRAGMAKKILDMERQRIDSTFDQKQLAHERSVDEAYREKLESLRLMYRGKMETLSQIDGYFSADDVRSAREQMRRDWLSARRDAFEQYDREFHRRIDAGVPLAEDVEAFRQQELREINEQHEHMINFEAQRLGIDAALDSGLISRLVDGDFSKEASRSDLQTSLSRGFEDDYESSGMSEVRRFVDDLWQPELEAIKCNAVMRAVASPVRSRNIVDEEGHSYDENHFVLPIDSQEFTEYVIDKISDNDDVLALSSGLSESLSYGTKEEAMARAKWFCDVAVEVGLDIDEFLNIVEAHNITHGRGGDQKWNERFYDLTMGHRFDEELEKYTAEQEEDDLGEKGKPEEILEALRIKLKELEDEFGGYEQIVSDKRHGGGGNDEGDTRSVLRLDEIAQKARDIVLVSRRIQHINGTRAVIDNLRDVTSLEDDRIEIGEPVFHLGKWLSGNRCVVSIFKVAFLDEGRESWAFISEGTRQEQEIYYGMRDSLDDVKELFSERFYRLSGYSPNINDEAGVKSVRHFTTVERLRDRIAKKWSGEIAFGEYMPDMRTYREAITDGILDLITKSIGEPDEILVEPEVSETSEQPEQQLPNETVELTEDEAGGDKSETRPTGESTLKKTPKQLFQHILTNKAISSHGRDAIRDTSATLSQLLRTPKQIMERMLSRRDIEKLIQILDENEVEHPQWIDSER